MDDSNNVYKAPEAALLVNSESGTHQLADRKIRLVASLVDALIGILVSIPFMIFIGPFFGYEKFGQQPSNEYLIASTVFGLVALVILHGYFLHTNGQTIGKKLLKIKIVSLDGEKVSLSKLISLRYAPIYLSILVPIVGTWYPMVDALFIFRKDRRCLHDFIAGTKVIKT
jgi:uncharacterized RDD family membrane protein YckC